MARSSNRQLVLGAAAGAIAGLAASWAMNLAAKAYARATTTRAVDDDEYRMRLRERELLCIERSDPTGEGVERLATRFGIQLTDRQVNWGRDLVHYGFGIAAGAAYGALAERYPKITGGFGLGFAAALLIGGEEIATPAAGLLAAPWSLPLAAHAAMTASHIVYGLTLESTRRVALRALESGDTRWLPLAKSA